MLITIDTFGGMTPIIAPHLLPANAAQVARDARLMYGDIRPMRGLTTVGSAPKVGTKLSIYRLGQDLAFEDRYWLHFTTDTDVVKGPIAGDVSERTYMTDGVAPKKTNNLLATNNAYPSGAGGGQYPINTYELGVPAPTNTPSPAVNGTATNANDTAVSYLYVQTYVTSWGEESAPSPVSAPANIKPGQWVVLSNLNTAAPAGSYSMSAKRIYRSNTGTNATDFQLLAEVSLATASYTDKDGANNNVVPASSLAEVISTKNYAVPPANLYGLTSMAGGITAGFIKGTGTVCFSPINLPYTYPVNWRLTSDYEVVGLGAFDQSLLVCTKGFPYIATGTDPSAMSFEKIALNQACVSKRSIVSLEGGVAYASPDGIVFVSSQGAKVITADLFTRDEWQTYNPSSMLGCQFNRRYILFYDNGTTQGSLIFDFSGQGARFVQSSLYATAAYNDPLKGALYLCVGNNIQKWDSGSNLTALWRSKVYRGSPRNFSCARVIATGTVTCRVYADGVLRHTQTVTSQEPFRLPAGFLAREWEIEVEGTANISRVMMATDVLELKDA